jgi:plastocyanin domain-containing protein
MKNKMVMLVIGAMIFALSASVVIAQNGRKRTAKATKPKAQTAKVELTENGYQPNSFKLRKGILARVTFTRRTDVGCGQQIVLPDYGIKRELPLNQPVTVKFKPNKTGNFNFTCGMGMMRGTIIVR